MMLLDSNNIIYSAQSANSSLRMLVADKDAAVFAVTFVEVLGYHGLTPAEKLDFEQVFATLAVLPITQSVMDAAVRLRQQRKMKLGDALVAGTAITHGLTLVTHNTKDFSWIGGLNHLDPLAP